MKSFITPLFSRFVTFSQTKERLALQETKEMYAQLMSAIDALSNKATTLLENSGLLLTLFSILQIALVKSEQTIYYKIGLGTSIILYVIVVILLLRVLSPKNYRMVFVADWDGVDKAIRNHSLEQAYTQLLSNYLARIQHNDAIHHRNAICYQWAIRIFGIIMILQVALSLIISR